MMARVSEFSTVTRVFSIRTDTLAATILAIISTTGKVRHER